MHRFARHTMVNAHKRKMRAKGSVLDK